MKDCIFCKIVKGESPAKVELESDNVIAFKSIDPVAEEHILVVPKKHIETFMDIGTSDKDLYMEIIEIVQALIKKKDIEDAYKLIFNGGNFQAIPHLHWHLLGGEFEDVSPTLQQT